jgi:hypothetical protein
MTFSPPLNLLFFHTRKLVLDINFGYPIFCYEIGLGFKQTVNAAINNEQTTTDSYINFGIIKAFYCLL